MELGHLNELLDTGLDALQREFLSLLQKHSRPIHIATLRDIAACEDVEGKEREREEGRRGESKGDRGGERERERGVVAGREGIL